MRLLFSDILKLRMTSFIYDSICLYLYTTLLHMSVYFTQINYTAMLQLIKYPHNLLYKQDGKIDTNTQHYALCSTVRTRLENGMDYRLTSKA
jgi:hypothetical protein